MDPPRWLDEHGDYLFRYALSRLGNRENAEDAVQEALLAALKSKENYSAAASERNWLMAILKNKIFDRFRLMSRERKMGRTEMADEAAESLFNPSGHWINGPSAWDFDPSKSVEDAEFRKKLDDCMAGLPDPMKRPLTLKLFDDKNSEEICNILEISPTNLRVRMYRARTLLRECLEHNWFVK